MTPVGIQMREAEAEKTVKTERVGKEADVRKRYRNGTSGPAIWDRTPGASFQVAAVLGMVRGS